MSHAPSVKVRFPPSPTGLLHVGNAMTMMCNWLFAKKYQGEIVMRLEDTDTERSTKEFEDDILASLTWLGLAWDGPVYRQSERAHIYRQHLEQLIAEKKAFWCYHSKEDLEAEQKLQMEAKEPPRHICAHKDQPPMSPREKGIIRLAVHLESDRVITFQDLIRGPISFRESLLGHIAIARSLDSALYHFTVTVDDGTMGITHVIRGEDHISNTPKQILIYEALGMAVPQFAHLPLLLGADRSKLSKRHGATAVSMYRSDYTPDALFNFLVGTVYTFSSDIMSREDMVKEFEISRVHTSGAIFDTKKLNWLNAVYIRNMEPAVFAHLAGLEHLPEAALRLVMERLEKISDKDQFAYLWHEPVYDARLLIWKNFSIEQSKASLLEAKIILSSGPFTDEVLRRGLDEAGERLGNRGLAYWPLRVALSGRDKSPDPVQIALAIGQVPALRRIDQALALVSS